MMVAEEVFVVAEHQKEVKAPQHHIKLHKRDDAGVACHRLGSDYFTPTSETYFLYPSNKVAAVFRAEYVHRHYHHPHSE